MVGLLTSLILPWAMGYIWLSLLWKGVATGSNGDYNAQSENGDVVSVQPVLLGYGYLIGIQSTTFVIRLLDATGIRLSLLNISLPLVGITILGWVFRRRLSEKKSPSRHAFSAFRIPCNGRTLASAVFLGLILLRTVTLGIEVWTRPLFPWDAWTAWAQKSNVWFELRHLVPFVSPALWLKAGGESVFTGLAYDYPPTVPLIQVWSLLGLGHWDDALMNSPWLLCLISITLAFYGQARLWGIAPHICLGALYMLVSLPLLDAHVALAGYADLWMAGAYGLAAMAFLHWARSRDLRQGILALLMAVCAIQIKAEGIVWVLTLLPAMLLVVFRRRWLVVIGGSLLLAAVFLYVKGGFDIQIPFLGRVMIQGGKMALPGLGQIELGFSGVGYRFVEHMFFLGSWHLFWYFTIGILLLGLPRIYRDKTLLVAYIVVGGCVFLVGFMFFFTEMALWAQQVTALNRILLHAVLTMSFVVLITFHVLHRSLQTK
jgi:hypothetical protein